MPGGQYFHAQAAQTVLNLGGAGILNVWRPRTESESNDDHSLMQTWVINSEGPLLQTVEAGWEVCPTEYGDDFPHLFVFYTTNGYTKNGDYLGSMNTDYHGWVQVDSVIYPGALITNSSVLGGNQVILPIQYQLLEGNWWFRVLDTFIGYYPGSLFMGGGSTFGNLGDHADLISFGGEVLSNELDPVTSRSEMGSGVFAEGGMGRACFQSNLTFQADRRGTMVPLNGTPSADNAGLYDIQAHMISGTSLGSYFFAGGPGTQASKASPALVVTPRHSLELAFIADDDSNDILVTTTHGPLADNTWSGNTPVGQSSKFAPSLATLKDRLYMAFVADNDSNQLLLCSSADGLTWSANTRIGQASKTAPSLALSGNRLLVAFVAYHEASELLVSWSDDYGQTWSGNVNTGQFSKTAPSLAAFNGDLYLAFVATDDTNDLLVCKSSNRGQTWSDNVNTGQFSKSAPSLAQLGTNLFLAFVANNDSNDLLISSLKNGSWTGNTPVGQTDVPGNQSTKFSPSLAVFGGELPSSALFMAYVSNSDSNTLLSSSASDGVHWSGDVTSGQSSKASPSLAALGTKLFMAFVADNNSNEILICSTPGLVGAAVTPRWMGLNGAGNTPVGQSSKFVPSLATLKDRLYMAFVADNDSNQLLLCSSADGLTWSANTRIGQASKTAPSLALSGNRLLVAFVAYHEASELLVSWSDDYGQTWSGNVNTGQFSKTAPSLAAFNGDLYLAFVATDDTNDLLVCKSSNRGQTWSDNVNTGQFSKSAPSLAQLGTNLFLAFVANNDSNDLLISSSGDGAKWAARNSQVRQSSKVAPSLSVFEEQLSLAFVADNNTDALLVSVSQDGVNWSGNLVV